MHLGLDLLRTIAMRQQLGTATIGAFRWYLICIPAIMARELIQVTVEGERYIAVLTMRHPSTLFAFDHRRIAPAVLEKNRLFPTFQSFAHLAQQQWREGTIHHLPMLQILDINHLYLRQFYALIALKQFHQTIFTRLGIMIGLQ